MKFKDSEGPMETLCHIILTADMICDYRFVAGACCSRHKLLYTSVSNQRSDKSFKFKAKTSVNSIAL